jgi:hypothetical protein
MTKIVHNQRHTRIEAKDGRKVLFSAEVVGLSQTTIEGILAGFGDETPTLETLQAAIEAAKAKRGSVVPEDYRVRYGADQNCGDDLAKALSDATTIVEGKTSRVDLEAAERIAGANGIGDRFDGWMAKGLNPGMVRMNLGNVLRGMQRRGEEVTLKA